MNTPTEREHIYLFEKIGHGRYLSSNSVYNGNFFVVNVRKALIGGDFRFLVKCYLVKS